ncbi:MAG: zinc-binding dehydrogenase [Actinomycetia bacterium]|nr:zinc-binding dehydrogenase [Actinomycetes bacterium]
MRDRAAALGGRGPWGVAYHLRLSRLALQRAWPGRALQLGLGALAPADLGADPRLPAEAEWLPVRPLLAGVCGSDWGVLLGRSSPYLAPVTSFPAVLGHEVYGELLVDGPWPRGTRVVVDPSLACASRGATLCRACRTGRPDNCERRLDGGHGPGLLLGYHRRLPGGWSTRMFVPAHQLHPVPDGTDPRRAVLAEPLAIVLKGLRRVAWTAVETVLVVGSGPIGLLAALAVREEHPEVRIHAVARYPEQAELAAALADAVVLSERDVERCEALGPSVPGRFGAPAFHAWGFDLVIDAIGSAASFQQAVATARPGGQVLLVGGAGRERLDLAPVWTRNLTVAGTYGYVEEGRSTFPRAVSLVTGSRRPLERVVGVVRPLSEYRRALRDFWPERGRRIKLAFAPDA